MAKIVLTNTPIRWRCTCGRVTVDVPADPEDRWVREGDQPSCPWCGDRVAIEGAFEFEEKKP